MNEKEIEKNFNDKIINYKKALYTEFIDMFGEKYRCAIIDALSAIVVYNVRKIDLNYYEENYDTLNSEDQDVVDYFKERLEDNDNYIVGSSLEIITDDMINYQSLPAYCFGTKKFINCTIVFNPRIVYSNDEDYVANLIGILAISLIDNYNDNIALRKMRFAIAAEIVRRLRTKGFYLFDNKELLEEYSEYFEEDIIEYSDITCDRKLLSPILSALPLAFTNISEFYKVVGRENFDALNMAYTEEDAEECYASVSRMKDSLLKNSTSTVVMLDMPTISKIIKSVNDKKSSNEVLINNPETPGVKTIPHTTHRRANSILSEKIIKKDIETNDNFYNIKKEEDYYIDEDGKDTLDPPSRLKR